MNKSKISVFLLLICLNTSAQVKTNLLVHYDINYDLGKPIKKTGIAKITKNKSLFHLESKKVDSKLTLEEDGTYSRIVSENIINSYFMNFENNSFTLKEKIIDKSYLVKTKLHKIDWKITEKTKKIGSFDCQLAIGAFRGRVYNAWFTTQIPVRSGPWKLHGLPGLILEAVDSLNQVQFLMKSVKTISTPIILEKLKADEEITFEEYVKKKKNYSKDFLKMIDSKLPREMRGSTTLSKSKGLETFNKY